MGQDNIAENRLFAYQRYVGKLEKTIHRLVYGVIILACMLLILSAYIVWVVK
jgi:hypothetical protein